jgi:hypothetical protein
LVYTTGVLRPGAVGSTQFFGLRLAKFAGRVPQSAKLGWSGVTMPLNDKSPNYLTARGLAFSATDEVVGNAGRSAADHSDQRDDWQSALSEAHQPWRCRL